MKHNFFLMTLISLWGLILSILFNFCHATKPIVSSITQTQTKLKQLDIQINKLRHNLGTVQDKRGILNQELSVTEKQIGEGIRKLRSIQTSMGIKEHGIAEFQDKVRLQTQQLKSQQQLLASHLRARYLMGEYQPLKWILTQNDPYQFSRIVTYHQYIIKSRQILIDQIDATRKKLKLNNDTLQRELAANQSLTTQLNQHQRQLQQNKRYHTTLLTSLGDEIQSKQNVLREFQRDKANLTRLLKSLSQQNTLQNNKPFAQMRKKLPLPIQVKHRSLGRMHQGVTFFADEGTVVTAVYPGKIVFSDWLKGYGLLLIIDHGQGFMTLYAHNQSLFKHKGQMVHQNEQIASVGHSGGIKQNGLYFEIRLRGKAISPLDWLS